MLDTLWTLGQEILLQELVAESRGKDVRALVIGDRVVAAMRRTARAGEFRSNIHRGGVAEAVDARPRVRRGGRQGGPGDGARGGRRGHARGAHRAEDHGGEQLARASRGSRPPPASTSPRSTSSTRWSPRTRATPATAAGTSHDGGCAPAPPAGAVGAPPWLRGARDLAGPRPRAPARSPR